MFISDFPHWETRLKKAETASKAIKLLFEPLRLLRSIKRFEIRDGSDETFPPYAATSQSSPPLEEHAAIIRDISTLVQEGSPCEYMFEMFAALSTYAQAF